MYCKCLQMWVLLLISSHMGVLGATFQDSQQLTHQLSKEIKANLTEKYSHIITPGIEKNWLNPLLSTFEEIAPGIIDLHAQNFENENDAASEELHSHLHSKSELQHRLKKRSIKSQKVKHAKKHALNIVKHIKKDLIKAAKTISAKKSK